MPRQSAGLLLYRQRGATLEVLLVHPGGPFWMDKDEGAWMVPKGEYGPEDNAFEAACREFEEETGFLPEGEFLELTEIRQTGGKRVKVWAIAGDCDPAELTSNTFRMEWPPRSGQFQTFPEVDRHAWFSLDEARLHILKSQLPLLDELVQLKGQG